MTRTQKELLQWAEAAADKLDEYNDDIDARILRDGGRAIIREIKEE